MSFSSEAKAELCQAKIAKKCCALAESYGVLLYANTFSAREVRIITASPDFAQRLPRLFQRAFGLGFDKAPAEGAAGKQSFLVTEPDKLRRIFNAFGAEPESTLTHHVNYGVLEEDCDRLSFLRGAFLAGGSTTDPEKGFHLELATPHRSVSRETCSLLLDMGLTTLGAMQASMLVQTAKVEKEMRNTITRRVNCDSANADKVVSAAQEQIDAIRRIVKEYGLDALPEPLKDTALLRIANPEASLADLARLSYPPVSKSCLSHRLKKIMSFEGKEE